MKVNLKQGSKNAVKSWKAWLTAVVSGVALVGLPLGWYADAVRYYDDQHRIVEIYRENPEAFESFFTEYSKNPKKLGELMEFFNGVPKLIQDRDLRAHHSQLMLNDLFAYTHGKHENGHALVMKADSLGNVKYHDSRGNWHEAHFRGEGSWYSFFDNQWHKIPF